MKGGEYLGSFFFRCGSTRVEEAHCHPYHELVLITSGRMELRRGRTWMAATRGDVVLLRQGERHVEANSAEKPLEFFSLNFLWPDLPSDLPTQVQDVHGRVRVLFEWLNENWWWYSPHGEQYAAGIMNAIVAEVIHLAMEPDSELISAVRHYIAAHIAQPLTLADLAAHVHLSRTHFARRYRELSGLTPLAEVRRMRIAEAVRLLQSSDLPLKDIADRIGLSSASSLAHLFRKYVGATPAQIRRGTGKTKDELRQGRSVTTPFGDEPEGDSDT